MKCCYAIVTTGGKTWKNVKSSDTAQCWQITPVIAVCVCVPLLLCECVFACEVFCSPEDALAGWQVQAMGKLGMDGIAMDSADGLSLKKHSPIWFLNFSQYLLNTLQPVPPSICACVFLWFVCSEIILQPYNHLLFWIAAGYGYVPDSHVFFFFCLCSCFSCRRVRRQCDVVPS